MDVLLQCAALSLEEEALRLKAEHDEQTFKASQHLEGIKLGREIARDDDNG